MKESILVTLQKTLGLLNFIEICRREEMRAEKLLNRFDNNEITVSVIGQFKRGKSSLVNAMLGEKLMPVGIIPVTSAVTRIVYGGKATKVHFENGKILEIDPEDLPEYISEQKNPNNEKGVLAVTLYNDTSFIKEGLTFVDTPGVGSVHKHNSEAAYSFVKESDGVIFLLSVDSPINEIEIDFLKKAKDYAGKFYFVVNKIDIVEEDELQSFLDYCQSLLLEIMEVDNIKIYPVSAKKEIGIDTLRETFMADYNDQGIGILEESIRMKLIDIINSALSQLDLYWKAMVMPVGRLEVRTNKMKSRIEDVIKKAKAKSISLQEENIEKPEAELDIYLNELTSDLSKDVNELFNMEYHYEIKEVEMDEYTNVKDKNSVYEDFIIKVEGLCQDLQETLGRILLYREDNAITVAFKIDEFAKVIKKLKAIKDQLIAG